MSLRSDVYALRVLIEDFRPGTVRHWRSGDFVKQVDGTWQAKASPDEPIATDQPAAKFNTSDKSTEDLYKRKGKWTPERAKMHQGYIDQVSKNVPKSDAPIVYMTGGGPASGKSKALLSNPKIGIPSKDKAVHADPDGAKEFIPEFVANKHLGDHSVATRVHEESAYMSQQAIASGLSTGKNVVYDSSGDGGIDKLAAKVQRIRDQGAKKVVAHYATVDIDEAIRRSDARALKEGRFVPHEYLKQVHKDVTRTFLGAVERGVYDDLDLWDTSAPGEPINVVSYTKADGLVVKDQKAWDAFKKRGE